MNYSKQSSDYKGTFYDNVKRPVDGFIIDQQIHLVYNLGEFNQTSSIRTIEEIKKDENSFLWTPYLEVLVKAENEHNY